MQIESMLALLEDTLHAMKANDVVVLKVDKLTTVTDYMVICSATSSRHVKAINKALLEKMKTAGFPAVGVEGAVEGEWILADFNAILVHIMQPAVRDFYQLEKLWTVNTVEVE